MPPKPKFRHDGFCQTFLNPNNTGLSKLVVIPGGDLRYQLDLGNGIHSSQDRLYGFQVLKILSIFSFTREKFRFNSDLD